MESWTKSGVANLTETTTTHLAQKFDLKSMDTILLAYGNKSDVVSFGFHSALYIYPSFISTLLHSQQNLLGKIRLELVNHFTEQKLLPKVPLDQMNFLWIVDFPLFTPNAATGEWETTHHPFTAPHPDDMDFLAQPETYAKCRSVAYDLVLNGQEIGGGSIRIHNADLQQKILNDILHLDTDHLSHLLEALESGCPPHGGIALGIDRLLSIICQTNSIRDVIAFPKSFEGKDLLSKAPCAISPEELQMYHLSIKN